MKFFSTITLALGVVLLLQNPIFADDIPGVKGSVTRLQKDKENAGESDKIAVKIGDVIEIDWLYPVVPESIPTAASAKADKDAVKFEEIQTIIRHKVFGAGALGAFFRAQKEGKATISFIVKSKGSGDAGVILKCEVEVTK